MAGNPDLLIEYLDDYPLAARGEIWDIDGAEKWEVTAYGPGNLILDTDQADIAKGGDGRPREWTLEGASPIHKIVIHPAGTVPPGKLGPGLGFDNFTARLKPGPCAKICCLGACCFGDQCLDTTEASCSEREGAVFHGDGSTCRIGQCVLGKDCFPTGRNQCANIGGEFLGSKPCLEGPAP